MLAFETLLVVDEEKKEKSSGKKKKRKTINPTATLTRRVLKEKGRGYRAGSADVKTPD